MKTDEITLSQAAAVMARASAATPSLARSVKAKLSAPERWRLRRARYGEKGHKRSAEFLARFPKPTEAGQNNGGAGAEIATVTVPPPSFLSALNQNQTMKANHQSSYLDDRTRAKPNIEQIKADAVVGERSPEHTARVVGERDPVNARHSSGNQAANSSNQ